MFASKTIVSSPSAVAAVRPSVGAKRALVCRAEAEEKAVEREFDPDMVPTSTTQGGTRDITGVKLDIPAEAVAFQALGQTQELINGRAAMLGLIAAAASEHISHQSVWSQIAGKYVNGEIAEHAHGLSSLYFGFIVAAITLASLAPKLFENQVPKDREFGPFKASAEIINGRAAMMGFAGLIVAELVMGSNPIF